MITYYLKIKGCSAKRRILHVKRTFVMFGSNTQKFTFVRIMPLLQK
ncbi:unnamed protein product [Plutella xylostella]|uniref:(diamondback moth) hypothetical protein n=1 Tax=Plutella xylostella TaxID=51655 RepID=A0A8S4ETK5_PLUXY|nr:unnamed protein product [Plutella xylostella]